VTAEPTGGAPGSPQPPQIVLAYVSKLISLIGSDAARSTVLMDRIERVMGWSPPRAGDYESWRDG
jgi:hypothetical protein